MSFAENASSVGRDSATVKGNTSNAFAKSAPRERERKRERGLGGPVYLFFHPLCFQLFIRRRKTTFKLEFA